MPHAELPTHLRGWIVALAASFVGFIAGFLTIAILSKVI